MTASGFEQTKADACVFRKIADKEAEMVVVVHVDDTLADAQAMERFAAELGGKFKVKSMMEKFGVVKASKAPASFGAPTISKCMSRRKIC